MKKSTMQEAAVTAVLFLLYLLLMFIAPFERGTVFYISLGFTLLSFLMAGLVIYFGFIKKEAVKSKFYGFPILKVSVLYVLLQFITALLFSIFGKWVPSWIPVLVYAGILAAALIGMIGTNAVSSEMENQDEAIKKDTALMRSLQTETALLKEMAKDEQNRKALSDLAEQFQYSDPVSSAEISDIENQLRASVEKLSQAVRQHENDVPSLCQKTKLLLQQRNSLCLMNKH